MAAAIAVIPPLVVGLSWHDSVYRALVLLVVACPCALVISTPVSIVAALAAAARKGVLIKGGMHLERASRIRCVAFDKTGTLTRGTPEVTDVVALNGAAAASVVGLAASVERRSTHPIAQAIHGSVVRSPANNIPTKPAPNSRYSGNRRLKVATLARFQVPHGSARREFCSERPASDGL